MKIVQPKLCTWRGGQVLSIVNTIQQYMVLLLQVDLLKAFGPFPLFVG